MLKKGAIPSNSSAISFLLILPRTLDEKLSKYPLGSWYIDIFDAILKRILAYKCQYFGIILDTNEEEEIVNKEYKSYREFVGNIFILYLEKQKILKE